MLIGHFMLAAVRMTDRFLCCIATPATEQMQHYLCCERSQHKVRIHSVGSFETFAAIYSNDRYARRPFPSI